MSAESAWNLQNFKFESNMFVPQTVAEEGAAPDAEHPRLQTSLSFYVEPAQPAAAEASTMVAAARAEGPVQPIEGDADSDTDDAVLVERPVRAKEPDTEPLSTGLGQSGEAEWELVEKDA